MIEYLLECLKTVITNLINPLFALNCFAQASKSAEVTPNLKSSDSDEPKNTCPIPPPLPPYRPTSKVCERAAPTQCIRLTR